MRDVDCSGVRVGGGDDEGGLRGGDVVSIPRRAANTVVGDVLSVDETQEVAEYSGGEKKETHLAYTGFRSGGLMSRIILTVRKLS